MTIEALDRDFIKYGVPVFLLISQLTISCEAPCCHLVG